MRVGRAHEDDVVTGERDILDEAPRRRQHSIGRVHDGLGFARRAGGIDQLDHVVRLRSQHCKLLLFGSGQ